MRKRCPFLLPVPQFSPFSHFPDYNSGIFRTLQELGISQVMRSRPVCGSRAVCVRLCTVSVLLTVVHILLPLHHRCAPLCPPAHCCAPLCPPAHCCAHLTERLQRERVINTREVTTGESYQHPEAGSRRELYTPGSGKQERVIHTRRYKREEVYTPGGINGERFNTPESRKEE